MAAYSQPRRHPRYPATLKVLVRLPAATDFSPALTMNLSQGGLLCQMREQPQVGDQIDLIAQLPGGDHIRIQSTVRHVTAVAANDERACRVGVQFEPLDEPRDQLLSMAISRLTRGN